MEVWWLSDACTLANSFFHAFSRKLFWIFISRIPQLNWNRGYKLLWAEQTFRLFIILATVISRRKNQWYIVSQLLLEQNIWHAWSLVFLPTKLSVLLKMIFFISLFTFLRYDTFGSRWSCDIQFHKYAVHFNRDFCWWIYDKLRPQILSVGTITNAHLSKKMSDIRILFFVDK
jgi:hypothetical protein